MSGVVSLSLEASTTAIPLIKGGKIKALAISGAERIPAMPDLPTMTEFGGNLDVNGVIGNSWHGIFTPTGTPEDIVSRLSSEIIKIVKTPDIQSRLKALGLTPTGMPGSTLTTDVANDFAFWGNLIRELNVKVE
jgi:tripartite-type tricarboxylate transporter receptor subunit TctC